MLQQIEGPEAMLDIDEIVAMNRIVYLLKSHQIKATKDIPLSKGASKKSN